MTRTETYCDGRLVKEIDQIDVPTWSMPGQYVDGAWKWFLDGEEIQGIEAEAFRVMWESQP